MKISPWKVASFVLTVVLGVVDGKAMAAEIAEQIAETLTFMVLRLRREIGEFRQSLRFLQLKDKLFK